MMKEQEAKYLLVIEWINKKLADGTLKPGDKLMSENELSEKFGFSRQTVRHATSELMTRGILTRVQGSGTYISHNVQGKEVSSAIRQEKPSLPAGGTYRETKYRNIAVISTFYESYIFPPTLKGIQDQLFTKGYSMQVAFTDNRIGREREILKSILEKDNIDGLILEPSKSAIPNPNLKYYKEILEKGIPIICFNALYPDLPIPCVRIDDRKIAEKATNALINAGHKNIAAIFKADDSQGPLRYGGYLDAILNANLTTNQKQVVWMDTPSVQTMDEFSDYLFKRIEGCTGVVCYNDQIAYEFINIALKRGLRIPENLSVVGIDDSYLATVGPVPLTSFPHPKKELGEKVAENLINIIENPEFDGNFLYDVDIIERDSIRMI